DAPLTHPLGPALSAHGSAPAPAGALAPRRASRGIPAGHHGRLGGGPGHPSSLAGDSAARGHGGWARRASGTGSGIPPRRRPRRSPADHRGADHAAGDREPDPPRRGTVG